jgi:AraC-like DNA-binding protein
MHDLVRNGISPTLSRLSSAPGIAAFRHTAMPKSTTRKRSFTFAHRQRLDRSIQHYLEECFKHRTAARASEFAHRLHRSIAHISRTASAIFGCTLSEYLREKQLEEAERLLLTTPLTIEEIALRAGFGTPVTFHRRFRQARGMTPGAFRTVKK